MDRGQLGAINSLLRSEEEAYTKMLVQADEPQYVRDLQGRVRGLAQFRKKLESTVEMLH